MVALQERGQRVRALSKQRPPAGFPTRILLQFSLFFLLTVCAFLPVMPIGGSSEAREATVVDTIVSQSEWVLPLRNGVVPSKPPFFHWLGALCSKGLGEVSEFSVRLPSALLALGILWILSLFTFRLAAFSSHDGLQRGKGEVAALTWGIVSLTYGFYQMSTMAMVDMTFAFFVYCAVAAPLCTSREYWAESGRVSPLARALFWCSCAGAVLARGPVGTLLPVALVASGAAYVLGPSRVFRELLRPSMGWCAFLIPLSWYYGAYLRGGEAFIDRQILFENVRRITGGEHMNTEVWWFYLPSLLRTTFPWWLLLALLLLSVHRKGSAFKGEGVFERGFVRAAHRIIWLPGVVLLVGIILFSIPSGKRHSYMVPLYPLLGMQVAFLLVVLGARGGASFLSRISRTVSQTSAVLVVALAGMVFLLGFLLSFDLSNPLVQGLKPFWGRLAVGLGLVALVGTAPVFLRGTAGGARGLIVSAWYPAFALLSCGVAFGIGTKSAIKDYERMALAVVHLARGDSALAVVKDPFDEYFDPLMYYAKRPVAIVNVNQRDLPCEEKVLYLARSIVFRGILPRIKGKIVVEGVVREFGDAVRGKEDREVVAYRCSLSQAEAGETRENFSGAEALSVLFTN